MSDYLDRAFEEKAMRKHRSYPIEFKRQVAQEFLAGETLHGLAKRHEVSRNLVRIWVATRRLTSVLPRTSSSSRPSERAGTRQPRRVGP